MFLSRFYDLNSFTYEKDLHIQHSGRGGVVLLERARINCQCFFHSGIHRHEKRNRFYTCICIPWAHSKARAERARLRCSSEPELETLWVFACGISRPAKDLESPATETHTAAYWGRVWCTGRWVCWNKHGCVFFHHAAFQFTGSLSHTLHLCKGTKVNVCLWRMAETIGWNYYWTLSWIRPSNV